MPKIPRRYAYLSSLLGVMSLLCFLVISEQPQIRTPAAGLAAVALVTPTPLPSPTPGLSPAPTRIVNPPVVGAPRIKPTINPTDPSKPAFTEQNVRDYYAQHNAGIGFHIGVDGPITVEKVAFHTVKDFITSEAEGPGMSQDLAPDRLVCFVRLSGKFYVGTSDGPIGPILHAAELFDARTGNVLTSGAG